MTLIRWIKKLLLLVEEYDEHIDYLRERINLTDKQAVRIISELNRTKEYIRERTDIHVDAAYHKRDPSTIIVIGRYRGNDYIETYQVRPEDFTVLVNQLRDMKKFGTVRTVDAPSGIKEYIRRDL